MKNSAIYSMAFASVLVLSLVDVEARGLGAGGGVQQQQAPHVQQQQAPRSTGRPGGGIATSAPSTSRPLHVPVQLVQRPPHVSRPLHVPAQSVQSSRQVSRPSQMPGQSFQKPFTMQSKPYVASRTANRLPISGIQPGSGPSGTKRPTQGQVEQFLNLPKPSEGTKPGLGRIKTAVRGGAASLALEHLAKPGEGAHRPGADRTGLDRPEIGERPTTEHGRPGVNAQVAQQIRNNYRQQNILDPRWWAKHPHLADEYWHNNVWYNHDWHYWWRPATWATAAAWFSWGWGSPVSYDFGDNVLYDNDIVYINGEQVATADEYYQQAAQLASTAKDDTADETEWLPLGVFALSQGDTGASNTVLQLAVSKEGVIIGTYYNSDTDIARPVKGTVDKTTQRAAWTFADGKDNEFVMETGINNLTQDQTEALVHFGKYMTQQWLMVRLQEPPAQKT